MDRADEFTEIQESLQHGYGDCNHAHESRILNIPVDPATQSQLYFLKVLDCFCTQEERQCTRQCAHKFTDGEIDPNNYNPLALRRTDPFPEIRKLQTLGLHIPISVLCEVLQIKFLLDAIDELKANNEKYPNQGYEEQYVSTKQKVRTMIFAVRDQLLHAIQCHLTAKV